MLPINSSPHKNKGEAMAVKIGKLEKVNLREVWKNEASDFTTWLSENIHILGETLNLNLTEGETEKKVEASLFSIDIATQTEEGEQVIIENQLEKTDHKHLGQILTYMINMDSKITIWITQNPRPEHIKVINYLNEELKNKNFYLVKVEAYSIDNSNPAPYFSVICQPSKEMKELSRVKEEGTEREKLKFNFWKALFEKSQNKTDLFSTAKPSYWTSVESKMANIKDISLYYNINKNHNAIGFTFSENQKSYFEEIKNNLEHDLGFELSLKEVGSSGGIGVSDRYKLQSNSKDGGYRDTEQWNEIQNQMIDSMIEFEKILKPRLSEIREEVNFKEKNRELKHVPENRDFFDRFIKEMKEEHPHIKVGHLGNNSAKSIVSEELGHITIFRAVDSHRVGIFWSPKKATYNPDKQFLSIMKKDSNLPKNFKIDDEGLCNVKLIDDIYDTSTLDEQLKFLKQELVLIYEYMDQKMTETELKKDKRSIKRAS